MSVASSSGSPSFNADMCAATRSVRASASERCTKMFCTEMQLCPAKRVALRASMGAMASTSASAQTMVGPLPPSSSATLRSPAMARISRPAREEPVKVMAPTRSSRTRARPASGPPCTTLTKWRGMPAS